MGRAYNFPKKIGKVLVSGGGGFVGRAVISRLLDAGISCRSFSRRRYVDLEEKGVESCTGDLADRQAVEEAVRDCDLVFHIGALAGIWGKKERYHCTNVVGTENMIAACLLHKIGVMVYTSTPSVVFDGHDITGADESIGYASRFLCHYAATKAHAEQLVLKVHAANGLRTCALRPHLVWGPGDPHLLPRLVESGRAGRLKQVGRGNNLVDISYIDNVAHAHILAAIELLGEGRCGGKAYFISDGKPVPLWNWINELYGQLGIPAVDKAVPEKVAYWLGGLLEVFGTLMQREEEPRMTRFLAEQLSKSHYFSINNAHRDFGYLPLVEAKEKMKKTLEWLKVSNR